MEENERTALEEQGARPCDEAESAHARAREGNPGHSGVEWQRRLEDRVLT